MSSLISLYSDPGSPLGNLSIRLSGPKPDPFIDLAPLPRITQHAHLPPGVGAGVPIPVRPECGDHIRVYVDAKYSLGLRTWLCNVEVPWDQVGEHAAKDARAGAQTQAVTQMQIGGGTLQPATRSGKEKGEKGFRVFNKARLALMGENGEVLVVA